MENNRSVLQIRKRNGRATEFQLHKMVDFFLENRGVALNQVFSPDGKMAGKLLLYKKWDELTKMLNAMEGPKKTANQWQRAWKDMKARISAKVRKLKLTNEYTDSEKLHRFMTKLDLKVLDIIGHPTVISESFKYQSDTQSDVEESFDVSATTDPLDESSKCTQDKRFEAISDARSSSSQSLNSTPEQFYDILRSQAKAINMIAEVQKQSAQATLIMAEAQKLNAEASLRNARAIERMAGALEKFADAELERIPIFAKLTNVLELITPTYL